MRNLKGDIDDPIYKPFIDLEAATHAQWLAVMDNVPAESLPPSRAELEQIRDKFQKAVDTCAAELDEREAEHYSVPVVFYGEFPGSDSDDIDAITLTIQDDDGVIRPHPH